MQLKRGRCREEALAPALDAQSRPEVSVLGPLRRWRVLEALELGQQLRRPTHPTQPNSQPASQYQQGSASVIKSPPVDEDLGARRAALALTPPSAGFQVPPLAMGVDPRELRLRVRRLLF